MVNRFFNTAGPIKPEIHYNIDRLKRIDTEEIMMLVRQQKYFVLHAPRQTGKTSCLFALRDYINQGTDFYAVYANVEAGQAERNNAQAVSLAIINIIAREASLVFGNNSANRQRHLPGDYPPRTDLEPPADTGAASRLVHPRGSLD